MSLLDDAAAVFELRDGLKHAHLLNPELVMTLRDLGGPLGVMLHGPLIIEPYHDHPDSIEKLNLRYTALQDAFHEVLDKRKHGVALFAYTTRPYRSDMFDLLADRMRDREYWRLASRLWIDQENPEDFPDEWRKRFGSDRPHRCAMMDADEHRDFAELPDQLTVFRGAPDTNGFSWTLDFSVAKFFARRFQKPDKAHPVWSAIVEKKHVFAFLTGRGESEALILDKSKLKGITRAASL